MSAPPRAEVRAYNKPRRSPPGGRMWTVPPRGNAPWGATGRLRTAVDRTVVGSAPTAGSTRPGVSTVPSLAVSVTWCQPSAITRHTADGELTRSRWVPARQPTEQCRVPVEHLRTHLCRGHVRRDTSRPGHRLGLEIPPRRTCSTIRDRQGVAVVGAELAGDARALGRIDTGMHHDRPKIHPARDRAPSPVHGQGDAP